MNELEAIPVALQYGALGALVFQSLLIFAAFVRMIPIARDVAKSLVAANLSFGELRGEVGVVIELLRNRSLCPFQLQREADRERPTNPEVIENERS